MIKKPLTIGDIVQLNPETHEFGGCLMVVTDPGSYGAQGYLFLDLEPEEGKLVRFKGRAYLRVNFEDMEHVGHVEWLWEPKPESATLDQ